MVAVDALMRVLSGALAPYTDQGGAPEVLLVRGWGEGRREFYCRSIPAFSITVAQRFTSLAISRPSSSGVEGCGSTPVFVSRSRTSGDFSAATISALSRRTTSCGMPAGPMKAYHNESSNSDTPVSFTVGRCGSAGDRAVPVVASARRRPDLTCPTTEPLVANVRNTWPPIKSVIAGALPLYGTCTILVPVSVSNSAPERCPDDPMPAEEYVS